MLLPHFFFFVFLFCLPALCEFKLKGGWVGGAQEEGREKGRKGVNCLPIDNSIITL